MIVSFVMSCPAKRPLPAIRDLPIQTCTFMPRSFCWVIAQGTPSSMLISIKRATICHTPFHIRRPQYSYKGVSVPKRKFCALTRIIHQPKKLTQEGTLGSRMMLKTAVSQEHHHPKTRASGCAGTVQIGLIVAIRHNASWQPPQAYNKLFARGPSTLSTALHRTC